jgi:hypothetical protein
MNPGEVVAGNYRIVEVLGRGGLGVVYRAVQLGVGRDVALKMMLPHVLASDEGRARFRREAELAKRLEHPNTVRLYDIGESESGVPFIVWELLKGRSLDQLFAAEGALAPERVAHLARQTLKSLMEAHALGIVHRDIKPSNLFVCAFSGEREFVKVLDFGIAKAADASGLTRDGAIGTPAYMSPEQVAGTGVTAASDLYALGLVLAEAVAGRAVYAEGSAIDVAMAQRSPDPPPIPRAALDSPLGPTIVRATRKDPALRFASAEEMLAAIDAAAPRSTTGGASVPQAASSGVRIAPPASLELAATAVAPSGELELRKKGAMLVGAAVAGAFVIAVVLLVASRHEDARHPAIPATREPRDPTAPRAPSSRGPQPPARLSKLTPKVLRERLVQLGWAIIAEPNSTGNGMQVASFTVVRGKSGGSFLFYRCDNEGIALAVSRGSAYESVVHEGTIVLATPKGGQLTRAHLEELGY